MVVVQLHQNAWPKAPTMTFILRIEISANSSVSITGWLILGKPDACEGIHKSNAAAALWATRLYPCKILPKTVPVVWHFDMVICMPANPVVKADMITETINSSNLHTFLHLRLQPESL